MFVLKLSWLIPFPYAVINYFAFLRYPVHERPPRPVGLAAFQPTLYFRFVTRGRNPHLSAETVDKARQILEAILPKNKWVIEVVSDNHLAIASADGLARLILVPENYHLASGTRYKARALNYALTVSTATDDDWVIHLDEETCFDEDTVQAIAQFVAEESAKPLEHRAIGQGVVLYGRGPIINWVTTLADSLRVGDDYGRFRLQYEHGRADFGLHGSFIVINNGVERTVGFDHGFVGSITEDAYFALLQQKAGRRFRFIHAYMYEKSPFSLRDFVLQRRRWFGGLWLCARDNNIPLKGRAVLLTFMGMWSTCWLTIGRVYLNIFLPTGTPPWLAVVGGISFSYYVLLYLIGFVVTFAKQIPGPKFFFLLVAQLLCIPIFSVLEAAGALSGLVSPPQDFYIVQKETICRPTPATTVVTGN
jgi:egghead protein (zeste-white 4 protein)